MKKSAKLKFLTVILILTLCLFTACFAYPSGNITYIYNADEDEVSYDLPSAPLREGYLFAGWFVDKALTIPYDIENSYGDITLYAKWEKNPTVIINEISSEISKATVKISAEFYNILSKTTSQGSGVIYKEDNLYYYVITNNHVVNKNESYSKKIYLVYDAYGYEYEGELLASDHSYDLAVLRIKKGNNEALRTLEFENKIPGEEETVISISSPKGQYNVISFGKIVDFDTIENKGTDIALSNVVFEVFWTDAEADSGSSGGALINTDLKLIGINYAVGKDADGNFMYSFAVPSLKIQEFLKKNGI